jgi:hypothetical protein
MPTPLQVEERADDWSASIEGMMAGGALPPRPSGAVLARSIGDRHFVQLALECVLERQKLGRPLYVIRVRRKFLGQCGEKKRGR